ncbi:lysoplasmalogenase [Pontimicrobium sp. MEBiC01747]
MASKQRTLFFVVFFILVFIETIIANFEGLQGLHYVSKPLIVGSLIVYFYKYSRHLNTHTRTFTGLALLFSLIGDILLLFVYKSEYFFIAGLIAFLTAHIMYCLVFLKQRNPAIKPYGFVIILLAYALGLFSILKSGLGDLLIPVIVYMCIILLMAVSAFLRRSKVNTPSFNLVFIGALAFMLSDSLLAVNKFYEPLALADFSIMFTYALAQLLIVFGLLKQQY